MEFVRYVCASSRKTIEGSLDESAAWFEFHQVAHLFDMSLQQATKLLRQAGATGDIDAARDVRSSGRCTCLLSHRAVVAVGYQANYGRATAFRLWCASVPTVLFQ
jgi:hypothetical protein